MIEIESRSIFLWRLLYVLGWIYHLLCIHFQAVNHFYQKALEYLSDILLILVSVFSRWGTLVFWNSLVAFLLHISCVPVLWFTRLLVCTTFLYLGAAGVFKSSHLVYRECQYTNIYFCCRNLSLGMTFRETCQLSISHFASQSCSLCWLLLSPAASLSMLLLGELSPSHSLTLHSGHLTFSISRQDMSLVPTLVCSTTHSQLYLGSITSKQMAQTLSRVWPSSHAGSSYSSTAAKHYSYTSVHSAKPCVQCWFLFVPSLD